MARRNIFCVVAVLILWVSVTYIGSLLKRLDKEREFAENFAKFQTTVDKVKRRLTPGTPMTRFESYEDSKLLRRVFAGERMDGTVTVAFFTGGSGFPPRHYGYIYQSDNDENAAGKGLAERIRRVRSFWFEWSD